MLPNGRFGNNLLVAEVTDDAYSHLRFQERKCAEGSEVVQRLVRQCVVRAVSAIQRSQFLVFLVLFNFCFAARAPAESAGDSRRMSWFV